MSRWTKWERQVTEMSKHPPLGDLHGLPVQRPAALYASIENAYRAATLDFMSEREEVRTAAVKVITSCNPVEVGRYMGRMAQRYPLDTQRWSAVQEEA